MAIATPPNERVRIKDFGTGGLAKDSNGVYKATAEVSFDGGKTWVEKFDFSNLDLSEIYACDSVFVDCKFTNINKVRIRLFI